MKNVMLSDGYRVHPYLPCFLQAISIDAFCDHHFNYFLKLVVAWNTLYIMIDYSTCIWAGITGTSCSAWYLSRRAQIVFRCCQFPWWRVMVLGRKNPIILLFQSDWFRNWEWLVTRFPAWVCTGNSWYDLDKRGPNLINFCWERQLYLE